MSGNSKMSVRMYFRTNYFQVTDEKRFLEYIETLKPYGVEVQKFGYDQFGMPHTPTVEAAERLPYTRYCVMCKRQGLIDPVDFAEKYDMRNLLSGVDDWGVELHPVIPLPLELTNFVEQSTALAASITVIDEANCDTSSYVFACAPSDFDWELYSEDPAAAVEFFLEDDYVEAQGSDPLLEYTETHPPLFMRNVFLEARVTGVEESYADEELSGV